MDPSYGKVASKHEELKVGFDGAFGQNHVSPRGLTSKVGRWVVEKIEGEQAVRTYYDTPTHPPI